MTTHQPIKFLLVDDLDANLTALSGLLQRDGLEILTAHSGPEALERLLAHDVALAFLDVQMPGMGGLELAETMRSTKRTRSVPIIFLTAGVMDPERRIRGYEAGAVAFLSKPIDPHSLLNKAAIFFELARQRQNLVRSNEQLAEADRRKNEFLAMLAHELRNPLTPLRSAAEILRTDNSSADERIQAQRIIGRQIENMSRMIDDLLDVSRITEGKIELRRKTVSLESILTAAVSLVRADCFAHGQEVTVSIPDEPVFLHADATRLEQVFGNLLTNACKYSGDNSHIALSARRGAREIVVTVSDDGVGISRELLPHIFELFVQASRTLDRAHGGLGIGLTLVQRIVKLHGGSITARSDGMGQGAEFTVRLPILDKAPTLPVLTPIPAQETSLRMLIVDDNTDSARSLAILQRRRGHVTHTAFTGPDAVIAAAEFLPEVVLLDIGLPGMDGFQVARKIRAMPALKGAFLVAMSGYGRGQDREEARLAGFDQYMVKPVDLVQLREWLVKRGEAV